MGVLAAAVLIGLPLLGLYTAFAAMRRWHPPLRARALESALALAAVAAAVSATLWLRTGGGQATLTEQLSPKSGALRATITNGNADGRAALVGLVFVLLTLLPFARWRKTGRYLLEFFAALLLTGLALISSFSVGGFFLPAAVMMLLAAAAGVPTRDTGSSEQ